MKNVRQSEILNIVQSKDIDTQEQLLEELRGSRPSVALEELRERLLDWIERAEGTRPLITE